MSELLVMNNSLREEWIQPVVNTSCPQPGDAFFNGRRLRPDKGLTINMKCKGTSYSLSVNKKSEFENNNKFKEIAIYPFFEHTSPLDLNGYSRTDDYLRG